MHGMLYVSYIIAPVIFIGIVQNVFGMDESQLRQILHSPFNDDLVLHIVHVLITGWNDPVFIIYMGSLHVI